jgi:hypothetical protein
MTTPPDDETADRDPRPEDAESDDDDRRNPAAGSGTDPSSGPIRDRPKVAGAEEDRNP